MATKAITPPVTQKDLMDVCKAMRDHLRDSLAGVEGEVSLRLGKALESRFDKAFGDSITKGVEGYLSKRLEDMEARYNERVEFLRRSYEEATARLEALLSRLQLPTPTVQVNVPELILPPAAVNVTTPEMIVPPAQVTVQVPDGPAPVAQFILPDLQLPAPVVNVTATPEVKALPAPVVNVSIPKRKMVKRIDYDAHGRPSTIEETEVDAEETHAG